MLPKANILVGDFLKIAALAGVNLNADDVYVEQLPAPHKSPTKLPTGKMAVYIFVYGDIVLKVGKVGPKSNARYTSQHYTGSAPSTLAKSLITRGGEIGVDELDMTTVSLWIKENTDRMNILLNADIGMPVLGLLESYLHCRLQPVFEGFASQNKFGNEQ
jgi:hypothetical protein